MDKKRLLQLEKNAHLSIAELRKKRIAVAKPVEERLKERARLEAVTQLAGGSEKLRNVAENKPKEKANGKG